MEHLRANYHRCRTRTQTSRQYSAPSSSQQDGVIGIVNESGKSKIALLGKGAAVERRMVDSMDNNAIDQHHPALRATPAGRGSAEEGIYRPLQSISRRGTEH